jgi:hypothetical protein
MFTCAEQYEAAWREIRGISQVEGIGEEKHVNSQKPVRVDLQNMVAMYENGFNEYIQVYKSFLSGNALATFEELKRANAEISFPLDVWAETVYTFMARFHRAEPSTRGSLLDAFRILWIGRLASFVKETSELDSEKTEEKIAEQAQAFVKLKPLLVDIY